MPDAQCTRSPAGKKTSHTGSSRRHRFTGTTGIPAHNGFNSYFVLSPAIGLFCHRRLPGNWRLKPGRASGTSAKT
jgi:hypothetical protein